MNTSKSVLDAWYNLLSGVISVPVYKRVPIDGDDNYVWLRLEGAIDTSNKRAINDDVTIITEIVTRFNNVGDDSVMEGIDNEITVLAMPSAGINGLTNPDGVQILNLKRNQYYPPQEQDGINIYLRKIIRYTHHIHQTT